MTRDELHADARELVDRAWDEGQRAAWNEAVEACAKLIERVRVRTWSPEECASQIRERIKR